MADERDGKKENILDIMAEIDAVGDGDKSHLQARVEKMEREIVVRGKPLSDYVEPVDQHLAKVEAAVNRPFPELVEDGRLVDPADQAAAAEHAVERGFDPANVRVGEYGSVVASRLKSGNAEAPRVNDFLLLDTTMLPEEFLAMLNKEVFGNYEPQEAQGDAEFGVIVLGHHQGQVSDLKAISSGEQDALSAIAKTRPMLIVKLDAGPWPWYDSASAAMVEGVVRRTGRRGWRCGWSLDKQWSWVEAWKPGKLREPSRITETVDGPVSATVTNMARERWGVDVRAAFDDLYKAAQWETLRQWLLLPEPRPTSHAAFVSLLAGKLLIQPDDPKWIIPQWSEKFPGRKPEDGPLHLHRFYSRLRAPVDGPGTGLLPQK